MRPTEEQARMLAALEQKHGRVVRVEDDSLLGLALLERCVSDTRIYQCKGCQAVFAIEPDGETDIWAPQFP